MTRVAAFDCGTNSLRLLVADVEAAGQLDAGAGRLVDVERTMRVVRLGEGVDRTGRLAPQALRRTLAVVAEYADRCRELGVERLRFVATSATRDAENRAEFVDGVRSLLGIEPEVVAGSQEARLAFRGATFELLADGLIGPFAVVDIGGGSTEVVRGGGAEPAEEVDGGPGVEAARSVDVGCVRLTERHLTADPPTAGQVRAARADVAAALAEVADSVDLSGVRHLVGLAGSVTTVAAAALDLPGYDSARIHRARLTVDDVRRACDRLLAMPRAQRAELPWMHPGRVDVIGGGALIWRMVVDLLAERSGLAEVLVSERDILDGIAFSLA
jgi:exopolyphosphatase / guanosine-5'-triphosphate,3'-diphosphate pyrophosphatase